MKKLPYTKQKVIIRRLRKKRRIRKALKHHIPGIRIIPYYYNER